MKLKITLTALLIASCTILFAQETKPDSNKEEDLQSSLDSAKERLNAAQKDLVRNAEKFNKSLASGELSPNKIAEYEKEKAKEEDRIEKLKALIVSNISKQKQEEANKIDAKKVGKEKEKAEKKARIALKDAEKKKRKLEEKQKQMEREKKLLEKKNIRMAEVKTELNRTKERLEDSQKKLTKDNEKHKTDLAKGNLSPNDISDFEKDKLSSEERIDVLKDKVTELEKKLIKISEEK